MNSQSQTVRFLDRGSLRNLVLLLGIVLVFPALSGCVPYCPLTYCLCKVSQWREDWGTTSRSSIYQPTALLDVLFYPYRMTAYPLKNQKLDLSLIDPSGIGGPAVVTWNPPKGIAGLTYSIPPLNPDGPPPYKFNVNVPATPDGVDLFMQYFLGGESSGEQSATDAVEIEFNGIKRGAISSAMRRYGADLDSDPAEAARDEVWRSSRKRPSSTRDIWISENWIYPEAAAGLSTATCQAVVDQLQQGTVFLGVRTPANPADTRSSWTSPLFFDSNTPNKTPVFEIQNQATPGTPIVRVPLILAPERIGWLHDNVPASTGKVWTAIAAQPSPAVVCPSGLNLNGGWEFYVRLPLDVSQAGESGCAGCKYELWFGGEGTSQTLANAVNSAARLGVGASPVTAGEKTGTVALGPVQVMLGATQGGGATALPLEFYSSNISSIIPPGRVQFSHTLTSRSTESQTVTLGFNSRLGLGWGLYEGTTSQPNLSKPITTPVTLAANASKTIWIVTDVSTSKLGSEVVTLTARSSLATSSPLEVTDAVQIDLLALPPTAAFSWSRVRPLAGQVVAFTDQSTGSPSSWAWDFGDGATSTSRNPSHAWAEGGRFEVSLTAAGPGGSNTYREIVDVIATQFLFPGVASATGVNATDWRSEAVLYNPRTTSVDAILTIQNRGTGVTVATKTISIAPGEVRAISDVYAEVGAPVGAGALTISGALLAWVRIFNLLGNGNPLGFPAGTTFGQDSVEISEGDSAADRDRFFPIHRPADLSTEFRSNLILYNPGTTDLVVTLAVGEASATATVPPKTYSQINNVGTYVGAGAGDGILRVRAAGAWSGSIATIDPVTGDPTSVRGLSGRRTAEALYPGVASAAGQNNTTWRSEAVLYNESSHPVTAKLEIMARGSSSVIASRSFDLAASEFRKIPDIYAELQAPSGGGALRVSEGVLSWVRTYNQGASGTFGQDAINIEGEYFDSSDRVAFPVRTAGNVATDFRSNLLLVNGELTPLTFTFSLGGLTKTQEVAPGAHVQVNNIGASIGAPAGIGLLTVTAPGRWAASVATIDPYSGDPTTVRGIPIP